MDLSQQVKNHQATCRQTSHKQVVKGDATQQPNTHHEALQALSNCEEVPYSATLCVVKHEGSRAPRVQSAKTRKPPGYIRNESGGMFSS